MQVALNFFRKHLPNTGLSTSHVFKYGEYDFPGQQQQSALQRCRVKAKFTGSVPQTKLNILDFIVRKSSLRQLPNFINYPGDYRHQKDTAQSLEITDINLETGRYGSKSGDSRIIRESWQPCQYLLFCLKKLKYHTVGIIKMILTLR